jgi:muconolactone delta-isomerase
MTLDKVPPDAYQQLGRAEMEYTQDQMAAGRLTQLLVTNDHRRYCMVFAVTDEKELRFVLEGFPLHKYFTIRFIRF